MRPPSRFSGSFEFVVVAVGVVGTLVAVVFVDEDAFLVGQGLVAVPAPVAFATQNDRSETGHSKLQGVRDTHRPPLRGGVTDSRDEDTLSGHGTGSGRIGLWREFGLR